MDEESKKLKEKVIKEMTDWICRALKNTSSMQTESILTDVLYSYAILITESNQNPINLNTNEHYLKNNKNNEILFNSEIFLDTVLNTELYRMLNILYLDCKDDFGEFDKELFRKMSINLYKKISARYFGFANVYKKL